MKRKSMTAATTIALALICFTLIDTTGYTAPPVTEPDAKAIAIVRAALMLTNPAHPKTARIHAEGKLSWNNEGLNSQQSTRTQRLSADWKVDFTKHLLLQRTLSYFGKELMWCDHRVASRESRYEFFCHSNVYSNDGPQQTDGSWFYRMDTTYPD